MYGIIISGLASSVISLIISHITQQPAITVNSSDNDSAASELLLWKIAAFGAIGYIALSAVKGAK